MTDHSRRPPSGGLATRNENCVSHWTAEDWRRLRERLAAEERALRDLLQRQHEQARALHNARRG